MTGNSICNQALILIGRLRPGQTASADDAAQTQLALNNLLDAWNAVGLAVYSVAPYNFELSSGVGDYTIGTGATFNIARPPKIEAWSVIDSSGAANGGKPVSAAEFAALRDDRTLTGNLVRALNYDAAFPTATIRIFPLPSADSSIDLWVWEQLGQIADFTLAVTLPPAYLRALTYNLAVDIAPSFRRPVPPAVQTIADKAKAEIAATNVSDMTRESPQAQPQPPK